MFLVLVLACQAPAPLPDADTLVDSGGDDSGCFTCPDPWEGTLGPSAFSTSRARTRDNPLKGFMTAYQWGAPANDFPDQLEFLYLPMADLWGEGGETLGTGLEPHLEAAAERGHHLVVRVYIDYPAQPSGLPGYLEGSVDCASYEDHGGGCSPDYDDPDLLGAMLGLIASMGGRYDGDPRLGFVQVGLLGFWGEWHTWPNPEWFPSQATQEAVLDAYETAFQTTQLQVRYATQENAGRRIGYHDDSFAYSTLGDVDWFFVSQMESAGAQERWKEVVIGGELRPELQGVVFEEGYELGTYAQDVSACIDATHASYLLNYTAFNGDGVGYTGEERARAEEAALALGYQFEVVGAALGASDRIDDTAQASLSVEISQTGVAPFYYPLFLQVKAEGLAERVEGTESLNLLPGEQTTVQVDLGRVQLDLLQAPLVLGLDSPLLQEGQRIRFATETPWSTETDEVVLRFEVDEETDPGWGS